MAVMTLYHACECAEGFGAGIDATEEEKIAAWQYLIDTGAAWNLQGWYGRVAFDLIERGICHKPKERRIA